MRLSWLLLVVVAHQAAIYHVGRAGYVRSVFGGQEGHQSRYVGNASHAPQGNVPEQRVEFGLVFEKGPVDRRSNRTRSYVVDRDAEWPEFYGKVTHQHPHPALAATIGREAGKNHVL